MTVGERIKRRRLQLGLSVDDIADKLGKSRATVYRYENGDIENMPYDVLIPLAKILDTRPGVLTGWMNEKDSYQVESVRIPILGRVVAGVPLLAIENFDDDEWEEIPKNLSDKGEFFALRIKGNSMEPKMSQGDVIIVKKQSNVNSGEIAVIMINGENATVKKVVKQENGIMLLASNQEVYPPHFYSNEEIENLPITILGKVIELRAKF